MPENDQILLNALLAERKGLIGPNVPDPDAFEFFVAEQLLKNYGLSYEELEFGNIDGGNDDGIDRIYAFLDGDLIGEDTDTSSIRRNPDLDLFLIQSKTHQGFSEAPLLVVNQTMSDLLGMATPIEKLAQKYNTRLIDVSDQFRRVYQDNSTKFPNLTVHVCYASRGTQIHPNVASLETSTRRTLENLFSKCELDLRFLTAGDLVELHRRTATSVNELQMADTPISAEGDSFVGLVKLSDFHAFVSDESGNLRHSLFESNVRDFAGDTEVNDAIARSLREGSGEDFWWLNNGVTILATRSFHSSRKLTIEDAQIVNGLQTSFQIHEYFEHGGALADPRMVLVRVVVSTDTESRDRIIRATNSQTHIPDATLHATDPLQRNLEEYFRSHGLYYERRKNHYKNMGKSRSQIVEITYLAQAVMATVLARPNTARARPMTLLKQQPDYELVFSSKYPIDMYLKAAHVMRLVDGFLKADAPNLPAADRNNVKFYVARLVVALSQRKARTRPDDIAVLDLALIDTAKLTRSLEIVLTLLEKIVSDTQFPHDRISKSDMLVRELDAFLLREFPPRARRRRGASEAG